MIASWQIEPRRHPGVSRLSPTVIQPSVWSGFLTCPTTHYAARFRIVVQFSSPTAASVSAVAEDSLEEVHPSPATAILTKIDESAPGSFAYLPHMLDLTCAPHCDQRKVQTWSLGCCCTGLECDITAPFCCGKGLRCLGTAMTQTREPSKGELKDEISGTFVSSKPILVTYIPREMRKIKMSMAFSWKT